MRGKRAKFLKGKANNLIGKLPPDVDREHLVKNIWKDTRNEKTFNRVLDGVIEGVKDGKYKKSL